MLCQLGITQLTIPPRAQNPHASLGSFRVDPTQPDGNWTDNTPPVGGDTVQRSDFGSWNGYIDQSGLGAINIGGINPGYTPITAVVSTGTRIPARAPLLPDRRIDN